jgi:hypothetical protein
VSLKILASHVCPHCRLQRAEWTVPGEDGKPIRRGGRIPSSILLRLQPGSGSSPIRVKDECPACGEVMDGVLAVDDINSASPRMLDVVRPRAQAVGRG